MADRHWTPSAPSGMKQDKDSIAENPSLDIRQGRDHTDKLCPTCGTTIKFNHMTGLHAEHSHSKGSGADYAA